MSTVQSSELAVMVAVALDLPACLEPNMLIDGFAFITLVLPIMIGQVPMIAARPGTQRQRAGRPRAARGYFLFFFPPSSVPPRRFQPSLAQAGDDGDEGAAVARFPVVADAF